MLASLTLREAFALAGLLHKGRASLHYPLEGGVQPVRRRQGLSVVS